MKFSQMFSNDFETSDNSSNEGLRTRYYRIRMNDAIEGIKKVAKELNVRVTGVTSIGEVTLECPNYFAIVTVVETHPMECAIDIKIETNHGVFDLGRGPKYIKSIYAGLDKALPFKGVGLYRG